MHITDRAGSIGPAVVGYPIDIAERRIVDLDQRAQAGYLKLPAGLVRTRHAVQQVDIFSSRPIDVISLAALYRIVYLDVL